MDTNIVVSDINSWLAERKTQPENKEWEDLVASLFAPLSKSKEVAKLDKHLFLVANLILAYGQDVNIALRYACVFGILVGIAATQTKYKTPEGTVIQ